MRKLFFLLAMIFFSMQVFSQTPASLPYSCNFEDATENLDWGRINNSYAGWATGTAAGNGPTTEETTDANSMYVSTDGGTTFAYTSFNYLYTYRYIDFGETEVSAILSYDWKCQGEGTHDLMRVFLIDGSLGSLTNSSSALATHSGNATWQRNTIEIAALSGVKRLVFYFESDGSIENTPPAIDNIFINVLTCPRPYDVVASNITSTTADISWTETEADSYIVSYVGPQGTTQVNLSAANSPLTIIGLTLETQYTVGVSAVCSGDTTQMSDVISFITPEITSFPWEEGFENGIDCWEQEIVEGTVSWAINSAHSYSAYTPHTGSSFAGMYDIDAAEDKTKLISPILDIAGLTAPMLEFYHIQKAWGNDQDQMKVFYRTNPSDTWIQLLEFNSNISTWTKDTISLPNPSSTYQIAFEGNAKYGYGVAIDDIKVYNAEDLICLPPTNLQAAASSNTASLIWNAGGDETVWQFKLGETGIINDRTSTVVNYIGLTPNTTYTVYVRSVCEDGTYSEWVGISFTTTSDAIAATLPYSYGFEDATENLAWGRVNRPYAGWATGTAAGNGPNTNNTSDNNAMYISPDNGITYGYTGSNQLYSYTYRDIDFGQTEGSYILSYDWKCQGYSNTDALVVFLLDPSTQLSATFPSFINDSLLTWHNGSASWQNNTISLDGISGVKRLAFFHLSGSTQYLPQPAIDNISITAVTCPRPYNVVASNITKTSAEISWTETGADSYIVYLQGSEQINLSATSSPITLTGLTPATYYTVSVTAICSEDTTIMSDGISFATLCDEITSFPWEEGFENTIVCWGNELVEGTTYWSWVMDDNYYTNLSGNFRIFKVGSYTNSSAKIISPVLDLTAVTNPMLEFYHIQAAWDADQDILRVYYRTSETDSWTQLLSFENSISTWTKDSISLPNPSSTYQIAFEGINSYGHGIGLDNIKVYDADNLICLPPTNLQVAASSNAVSFAWSPGGNETAWQVKLGEEGAVYDRTSTLVNYIGLIPNATDTVYVRSVCESGTYSEWVGISFTTTSLAIPASVPYSYGFEDATENLAWGIINRPFAGWATGTAAGNGPTTNNTSDNTAMYISPDGGTTYGYTGSTPLYTYTYRDIDFGETEGSYILSYDWKCQGNAGSDGVAIFLLDPSTQLSASFPSFANDSLLTWHNGSVSWQNNTISLDGVSGVKRLAFFHWSGSTQYLPQPAIDNISITAVVPCVPPTNLVASNITATTADISWTAGGDETSWQIILTDPGVSIIDITTLSYQFTELTSNTTYTAYVRANCNGNYSQWVETSFTTENALPATIPYSYGFEDAIENLAWGKINPYWVGWATGTAAGNGPNTNNASDNTAMYISIDNGATYGHTTSAATWLYTFRDIDFGETEGSYILNYDWKCEGDYDIYVSDGLVVLLLDPSTPLSTTSLPSFVNDSLIALHYGQISWQNNTIVLEGVSGVKRLVFLNFANSSVYTIPSAIDNISITAITCHSPENLVASNITTTTADLSWTSDATSWSVQYMLASETSWSNATEITSTNNSYTLTGLLENTSYLVRVKAICTDEQSLWSDAITLTTITTPASVPYYYGFEDATENLAWGKINLPNVGWATGTAAGNGPNTNNTSDNIAMYISPDNGITYGNTTSGITYSYTYRDIDFGQTEGSYTLTYDWKCQGATNSNGSTIDGLVLFLLDPSTPLSATFPSFANDSLLVIHRGSASWQNNTIVLEGVSGIKRLAFFHWSSTTQYLPQPAIDNISITAQTCPRPTNLVASNITDNSFDISFTSDASSWNIQYIFAYETWSEATTINTTTNTYSITQLMSNTAYQVRVQAVCEGEQSDWTEFITVVTRTTTPATLPYSYGFEDATENLSWGKLNPTLTGWATGTAAGNGPNTNNASDNTAMYISPDNGTTYGYTGSNTYPYTFRDIDFGQTQDTYTLTYDWKCQGATSSNGGITDGLVVFLLDPSTPLSVTYPSFVNDSLIALHYGSASWQNDTIILEGVSGVKRLLFFHWSGSTQYFPQPAIDNINIYSNNTMVCLPPTNLQVETSNTMATLSWNATGEETAWQVKLGETGLEIDVTTLSYQFTELTSNTTYIAYVRANCNGNYSSWISIEFTTLEDPIITPIPPTITTLDVTEITAISATFNANVAQGTEQIVERGFELKTYLQSWEESSQLLVEETSEFTLTYNELTENETYSVRAYVKTGETEQTITYGEVKNFVATNGEQPNITLGEVTATANVLESSVELLGEVLSLGGADSLMVQVGFRYTTDSLFINDIEEVSSILVGNSFSSTLTSLLPTTKYYYVAFITNFAGEATSLLGEFITNNSLTDNLERDNVNVIMYPNPAEKETKLVISGISGKVKISIIDIQGRIINSQTILVNDKAEKTLNLSSLTKGVYYIRLNGENINRTQKLIVK
ncbi:MAG: fibronectin type III domain-containing protein [Bacteroidales bacterium]|jgi:hypothetical protein|nr:fibronectin type III domain-containing protein [Bacteroidales bacterium]